MPQPQQWFTADQHFFHHNIREYCDRPFSDTETMHSEIIRRWRDVVGPEDTVWNLGDVSFGNVARTSEILAQLPGHICLVRGNHDSRGRCERLGRFRTIREECHIAGHAESPGEPWRPCPLYLRHAPDYTGVWPVGVKLQLAGHIHEAWRFAERPDGLIIVNVGVDQWDFTPVTLPQILSRLANCSEIVKVGSTWNSSRGLPSHYRTSPVTANRAGS